MSKKSKLENYFVEIFFLRDGGKSFKDISEIINLKYQIKCNKSEINKFLRTKLKYKITPSENQRLEFIVQSKLQGLTTKSKTINNSFISPQNINEIRKKSETDLLEEIFKNKTLKKE